LSCTLSELRAIREELAFIKAHMVDSDTILTSTEAKRLDEAFAARRAGKSIPLEELRR